jgi:hypothetical protein
LTGKRPKRWQPYQAYSRLYYDKKLHTEITNGFPDYIQGVPEGEKVDSLFKYRNRVLRVMLENESDDVKAEVAALCEKSVIVKKALRTRLVSHS